MCSSKERVMQSIGVNQTKCLDIMESSPAYQQTNNMNTKEKQKKKNYRDLIITSERFVFAKRSDMGGFLVGQDITEGDVSLQKD